MSDPDLGVDRVDDRDAPGRKIGLARRGPKPVCVDKLVSGLLYLSSGTEPGQPDVTLQVPYMDLCRAFIEDPTR